MKIATIVLISALLLLTAGCGAAEEKQYRRYQESIFDTFDTLVQVVAYTENEDEFKRYSDLIHARLRRSHKLYAIYNSYEGINNIKVINDNAGIEPVKVDGEIIDLIIFARQWAGRTGGSTNIALGPVLSIWHFYREEALYDPDQALLPPLAMLRDAAQYTDLDRVEVDPEQMTVYLPDKRMSLDVGAVAKGFAVEIAAREAQEAGMVSGLISAGGNIRLIGKPLDGKRDRWGIGVQDPEVPVPGGGESLLDTIYLSEGSVDTSGDYQRYYIVGEEIVHHLIDPRTLMPAVHFRAVTVVAADAGAADFLSTALFLLPYEESRSLAESIEDLEALWVMPDGEVRATPGMELMLQSHGATNRE